MSYHTLPTVKVGKVLKEILEFLPMSYSASSFGSLVSKRCFCNMVYFSCCVQEIIMPHKH